MATKTRSDELLALITTGKATASQKLEFATLLQTESAEEAKKEKEDLFEQGKQTIEKMGISLAEFSEYIKDKPQLIFSWVDDKGLKHDRHEGERGKFPAWITDMKNALTKAKAMEMAGTSIKGKAFIEAVYKP